MFYSSPKKSQLFLVTIFTAFSLFLILSTQTTFACGSKGCSKHTSSGKGCAMHSEATHTSGTHGASSTSQAPELSSFKKEKLYTCPMHPEVREKKSGKCPRCGMNLVKEEFYKVYTCAHQGCPSISAKKEKCCEKNMQMKVMSKNEYYALAGLQEEYFCPMHSDVVSAQAGKCPKCGMNLELRMAPKGGEKVEAR